MIRQLGLRFMQNENDYFVVYDSRTIEIGSVKTLKEAKELPLAAMIDQFDSNGKLINCYDLKGKRWVLVKL